MLTITSVIDYTRFRAIKVCAASNLLTRAQRVKAKRAKLIAAGLCVQHGNERPCELCQEKRAERYRKLGK